MKSRSFDQLNGKWLPVDKLNDCDPIKTNKDLGDNIKYAYDKTTLLVESAPAIPCGLVAKSVFTDTYVLRDSNGNRVDISEKDISWQSDRDYKFNNITNYEKDWKTI